MSQIWMKIMNHYEKNTQQLKDSFSIVHKAHIYNYVHG